MRHRDAMLPERYGTVPGAAAPFPAAPPSKWRPVYKSVIFESFCFKFGLKVDHGMGNNVVALQQRYVAVRGAAAPFPAAPPSKWRPFNNFVVFQLICFKFESKVDRRMRNDVATSPQRYGAVRGAAAPFPAASHSKWRPLNNSVIFQPICFKFVNKVYRWVRNNIVTLPQCYGAVP
jgi:hypothetical protein